MILPGMGVVSEIIACFARKRDLRLQLRRLLEPGDRRARLPGLGPPHVRQRPVGLRRPGVLAAELPGRRPVGDQGVQLDRHAVQGLDLASTTPMLYALGFIGLFTIGGLTGLFLATLAARRARARHLLRRRALPLHHGRRHGDGLPRRPALLVAEDHRPDVPRSAGASIAALIDLRRLQPDVLPAVHAGLPGHAAALPRLSAEFQI